MKIVQEESLRQVSQKIGVFHHIDGMSCLFFLLGIVLCATLLNQFIF